jgi:hypothetical protein
MTEHAHTALEIDEGSAQKTNAYDEEKIRTRRRAITIP